MSDFGVEAVRVDLVLDERLHIVTELFGVELFQEIDFAFTPASEAAEHVDQLSTRIDSALEIASRAGRTSYLGLGYWNDTSDPRTCEVIAILAARARRLSPGTRVYYTTPFIEYDQCADTVDFVLLDSKDRQRPVELVRQWRRYHDNPVGIAALGEPVVPDSRSGYRVPESAEAQARHIESALAELINDEQLVAVFINRWIHRRPVGPEAVSIAGDYGILRPDGGIRPAADVVKGFYTGRQRVFAFPAGTTRQTDYSWMNLIVFITTALFGLTYYSSPDLRSLLRRYFISHPFYLEKVYDGREVTMGMSLFLLGCLAVAGSIVGTSVVILLRSTNVWFALTSMVPSTLSLGLRAGARNPGFLMVAFSILFILVALVWAIGLSAVTRGSKRLRPSQTLLVTVIPRWPAAIIGLLVLVLLNWHIDAHVAVVGAIAAAWLSVAIVYTARMFSDYLRLLGISALLTMPILVLAMLFAAATVWLIVVTQDLLPEMTFLWNLATLA